MRHVVACIQAKRHVIKRNISSSIHFLKLNFKFKNQGYARKFLNTLKIINNLCSSSMNCLLLMIQKKKTWLEFPTTGISIGNLQKKELFWPSYIKAKEQHRSQIDMLKIVTLTQYLLFFPTLFVSQQTTHVKIPCKVQRIAVQSFDSGNNIIETDQKGRERDRELKRQVLQQNKG